jgi:hypothetical protein
VKKKRKKITFAEYNKKIEKIIALGKPVSDTLIDLLDEAAKYEIRDIK